MSESVNRISMSLSGLGKPGHEKWAVLEQDIHRLGGKQGIDGVLLYKQPPACVGPMDTYSTSELAN